MIDDQGIEHKKVFFDLRGELNLENFTGDWINDLVYSTDPAISSNLKGVSESLWILVMEFGDLND